MLLPAVIHLSGSFWGDTRNGTAAEKLEFVFSQLTAMTARCRITILELPRCVINGQDAMGSAMPGRYERACRDYNGMGHAGKESLAGVLVQCPALAHLDLSDNNIGAVGKRRLRASWCGQASGLCFVGTLHSLLFAICLSDRQQE